jgi:NADPH-dependent glutamate synthase beta subunit-like oxidoreductase
MELTAPDASGRRGVKPIAGSEHVIACDLVIKAVGQSKRTEMLSQVPGLQLDKSGRVVVNEQGQSSNPKFFAGGDCINGGKEIVNAAADGVRAAAHIDAFLRGGSKA